MDSNQPIIVLGPPRSGTSALAGALHQSGVSMGVRFLDTDAGNDKGYFEDLDFLDFHREILSRTAHETEKVFDDGNLRTKDIGFSPTNADLERAKQLIAAKSLSDQAWGWKDPHTCLFLPFWEGLISDAFYVSVYRHPLEVSASLLRMAKNWDLIGHPETAIEAWVHHTEEIMRSLKRREGARSLIFNASALLQETERHFERLQELCGLELDWQPFHSHLAPEMMTRTRITTELHQEFAHYFPKAAQLFDHLQSLSLEPMQWAEGSAESKFVTPLENFDTKTALSVLQNRAFPNDTERNNAARESLRKHTTELTRFRFAEEGIAKHNLEIRSNELEHARRRIDELGHELTAAAKKSQSQDNQIERERAEHQRLNLALQNNLDEQYKENQRLKLELENESHTKELLGADLAEKRSALEATLRSHQQYAEDAESALSKQIEVGETLRLELNQSKLLSEVLEQALPTSCFDVFGRPIKKDQPSVRSTIRSIQLERSRHANWDTIKQKVRSNQFWVVNLFDFIELSSAQMRAFECELWKFVSNEVNETGHLGNTEPEMCTRIFTAIQSEYRQANSSLAFRSISHAFQELASRLKMPTSVGEKWSRTYTDLLANRLQVSSDFSEWLEVLKANQASWAAASFSGFSSESLEVLLAASNLPSHPSSYLSFTGVSNKTNPPSYYEHWRHQLNLRNWRNIHHLGTSEHQAFDWPKDAGFRHCHIAPSAKDISIVT